MLLRTTLRRTLVKFGPTVAVMEIVAVDEEIVACALPAFALAGISIAARIVERNADLLAGRGRIGVDLEIARDVAEGLVEADDVPVAAVAEIDAVAVALPSRRTPRCAPNTAQSDWPEKNGSRS